jgi:cell wall-associated NlpC family hydrolase
MTMSAEDRARVVAHARRWIETPYHSNADVLGTGVDCGMLLVRAFVDAGTVEPFDPRPYPADWHLHHGEERYLGFIRLHFGPVERERAAPGDVVVFRYGRCYSHGGIVTGIAPLTIVHAFMPYGRVVEEAMSFNADLARPERRPMFFAMNAEAPL